MAGEGVVLADQMQLRNLVVGPETPYCWADEVPNWWGFDSLRTSDTQRTSTHGVRGGRDLLGAKTMTGQVLAQATDKDTLSGLIDAFMAAWAPSDDDIPVVAMFLNQKRRRYGRPRRALPGPRLTTRFSRVAKFGSLITFQFDALDPFTYSDVEHSASTSLPVSGGGFAVPFTPPFTVPASASDGFLSAPNVGTAPAPWTARLDGPLFRPVLTHATSGRILHFTANGGLDIAAGDYVILDSQRKSVLYNGVGDRRLNLLLGQGWFDLAVGANSIGLAADTGSGSVTFYWRDTYF